MTTNNKDFRVKHGLIVEANTHINGNLQVDGTINDLNVNSQAVHTQAAFDQANTAINNVASASQYANTGVTLAQAAYDQANTAASSYISSNNTSVIVNDTGSNSNVDIILDGTHTLTITANSLLPNSDQTFNLGSPSLQWKDVYIGPGSLYVNGQKVIQETSGTIRFGADTDQNLKIETFGDGNIELDPTQTGSILLQGPVQIQSESNISSSDGNPIGFASAIATDSIISKTINNNLNISANGLGTVYVNDDLIVTGNLTVQGSAVSLSVTNLSVEDNIIDISSETTGTPVSNAGIRVVRGDEAAVQLRWNESTDSWQFTNDGTIYKNIADDIATNSAINLAQAAYDQANTGGSDQYARNTANSSGIYANSGITLAQSAYNQGNSTATYANTGINNAASASSYANTGINNAASASLYANTGINNAASASSYANTGITLAQAAFDKANTGGSGASSTSNTTTTYALLGL